MQPPLLRGQIAEGFGGFIFRVAGCQRLFQPLCVGIGSGRVGCRDSESQRLLQNIAVSDRRHQMRPDRIHQDFDLLRIEHLAPSTDRFAVRRVGREDFFVANIAPVELTATELKPREAFVRHLQPVQ